MNNSIVFPCRLESADNRNPVFLCVNVFWLTSQRDHHRWSLDLIV